MTTTTAQDCLPLIKAEYLDLPGLNLTKSQIQRMCGVDSRTCDEIVSALEASGFLTQAPHGTYVLAPGVAEDVGGHPLNV